MLKNIGSTLKSAGDKIAEAQKSWRDDDLDAREQRLVEREAAIKRAETDLQSRLRAFERERAAGGLRKVFVGVAVAFGLVGAFAVGHFSAGSDAAPELDPALASDAVAASPTVVSDARGSETVAPTEPRRDGSFAECVARGDAYFKDIEAWPRLTTTGEDAHSVAVERCRRSTLAFG